MNNDKKNDDIKNIEGIEKLTDAIGFIDDEMISEYDEMCKNYNGEKKRTAKRQVNLLYRALPLAACFVLIIGGVIFAIGGIGRHLSNIPRNDEADTVGENSFAENAVSNKYEFDADRNPSKDHLPMAPEGNAEPIYPAETDNIEEFPDLEELLKLSDEEIKAVIRSNSNYYKTYVYHWNSHISQNTSNSCNFSVDNGSNITFTWDESGNIEDIIIDRATSDS